MNELICSTSERPKNFDISKIFTKLIRPQNDDKLMKFQKKLADQMKKRIVMMMECTGPPGEAGRNLGNTLNFK
jgi:hypothetical protein